MKNQRLIVGIDGCGNFELAADQALLSSFDQLNLIDPRVAAIILFKHNYQAGDNQGLQRLITEIKALIAKTDKHDFKIFADCEGGRVHRFQPGLGKFAINYSAFGACYDAVTAAGADGLTTSSAFALQAAIDTNQPLLTLGLTNLAPVVDLDDGHNSIISSLGRAFHQDPEICYQLAAAYVEGMLQVGMPVTLKHFPGHGYASGDSHISKVYDQRSYEELWAKDLLVFRKLISRFGEQIQYIMPAHVIYPAVDPDNPASKSTIWLQDILRAELGFKGQVISDCLTMKGADLAVNQLPAAIQSQILANIANPRMQELIMEGEKIKQFAQVCDLIIVNRRGEDLYELLQTLKI